MIHGTEIVMDKQSVLTGTKRSFMASRVELCFFGKAGDRGLPSPRIKQAGNTLRCPYPI